MSSKYAGHAGHLCTRRSANVGICAIVVLAALIAPFALAAPAPAANLANCPLVGPPVFCTWIEGGGELSNSSYRWPSGFALEGGVDASSYEFYEAEPGATFVGVPTLMFGTYTQTIELANEVAHPLSGPLVNPEVELNPENLLFAENTALMLPMNIKIAGPSLSGTCIVGPILLRLTTGVTSPSMPNKPITGKVGEVELQNGGSLVVVNNETLVDNTFAEPAASGCGSPSADALVDSMFGFPSTAGNNTVIFNVTDEFEES
jgi:hypothetical protein